MDSVRTKLFSRGVLMPGILLVTASFAVLYWNEKNIDARPANTTLTWFLRALGWVLMFVGIRVIMLRAFLLLPSRLQTPDSWLLRYSFGILFKLSDHPFWREFSADMSWYISLFLATWLSLAITTAICISYQTRLHCLALLTAVAAVPIVLLITYRKLGLGHLWTFLKLYYIKKYQ